MSDDERFDTPWEDDHNDDLDHGSDLDAFDAYEDTDEGVDDQVLTVLFTATNPAGTVSVTSLMDGQPLRVDLAPQVTTMTERQLGEEIALIAGLARQQARAAHHVLVAHVMRALGNDPAVTRGFLEHDLGLPAPDTVRAERAQAFASRYANEHD